MYLRKTLFESRSDTGSHPFPFVLRVSCYFVPSFTGMLVLFAISNRIEEEIVEKGKRGEIHFHYGLSSILRNVGFL